MGVFPCAWPSPKMGNISVPGVRSLLSIWNSLPTFPISFRRYVHNKADGAEEEGKDELGKEGPRSLTVAPRNFYINQCRVLEEQLSFAEEMSNQIISRDVTDLLPSANLLWPKSALTELRRVLSVGKSLIQECHNEPCLKAYLKQGERAQAFVETLKEIVWCMSVVFYYNNIKGSLKENPNLMANDQFPFVKLGAYKELHMLQKAALADQAELVTSLNIWIQNHYGVCSAKECGARPEDEGKVPPFCIAAQILGRRAKIDSAAIEGASEVDHTSVLWNINSHVLEDGAHVGAGSFCSVVETRWLGDTYARKIFQVYHPEIFKNEANALSKLSHRHMVTVSAYSVDLHTCSLLMERMKYDLRKYMKYKSSLGVYSPFSFPAAIDLMLQVAESLRYMHSQKMVHRDVKPANILVEEVDDPELRKEGFVIAKLADFGLAKSKREVTSYSHMTKNQGTTLYRAPEVFGADANNEEHSPVAYPFKTDVYSFGIVFSEILTGMTPFPDLTRLGDLYSLITDAVNPLRPELPERCPKGLASLIRDCWHTDPKRRPQFTEICAVLRHLKALLILTDDGKLEDWMDRLQLRTAQAAPAEFSSSLFCSTCDGSSWTVDVPWPEDMSNPFVMSVTEHQGALVAIHQRCTDSLFWRTYTGSSWSQPNMIHECFSRVLLSRPASASFQGLLFCVYCGEDNFVWYTYSADLKNWTQGNAPIERTIQPVVRPTLAAFGDRLISVIRGHANSIYWNSSSDPTRLWSPYTLIDSGIAIHRTSPVQLVVFNNELYCFVCGVEGGISSGRHGIFWSKISESQKTWLRPFSRIKHSTDVSFCPTSFTVFENRLVCIGYTRSDSKLVYGTVDVSRTPPVMSIATVIVPTNRYVAKVECLWVIDSKLFCVYQGGPKIKPG